MRRVHVPSGLATVSEVSLVNPETLTFLWPSCANRIADAASTAWSGTAAGAADTGPLTGTSRDRPSSTAPTADRRRLGTRVVTGFVNIRPTFAHVGAGKFSHSLTSENR
ncbi:hypothetical protein GCM10029964_071820 [Kibdelosporangium lantanae]